MTQKYKPTPEQCAEWIKGHQFTQLAKSDAVEVWRCQTPGTHSYAFDLTVSRYGMAMYGDTGALVFDVGSGYGLKFLTNEDDDYVFKKLDQSSRETDLDEAYLLEIVYRAIIDLLAERDLKLPEWLPPTDPMADRIKQLEDWLLGSECKDGEHSALVVALRECQDLEIRTTSAAYEWLSDNQELLELADDMDYSLGKPTNAVMQRIYMLRHAAKQILAIKAATPTGHSDVLEVLSNALVVETERAIKQRDEFLRTGVVTAGHGGSHDTCFPAILRRHVAPLIQEIERLSAPKQAPIELYAVHAEGPDDLYAAPSLEAAQQHAAHLNLIMGGMVGAKVIDSPWSPVEHWKTLAEQTQHQLDDFKAYVALQQRELINTGVYTALELINGKDIGERAPAEPEYAYAPGPNSDQWSDDGIAAYVSDMELKAGALIKRGRVERCSASSFLPDGNAVLEYMAERAHDENSEYCDDFPDVKPEAQQELEVLLRPLARWADKHCDVRFYTVGKIEDYTVTDDDVAAAEAYRKARQGAEA